MSTLRVTVTQLQGGEALEGEWRRLGEHARKAGSELVLLPEMIFDAWLPATDQVDAERWDAAVARHDAWLPRCEELGVRWVVGTRPVRVSGTPRQEAFLWQQGAHQPLHAKAYLPNEPGFWEAAWYRRGDGDFTAFDLGPLRAGMMICTEMWFTEHARKLGRDGAHCVFTPRCTEAATVERWIVGGRVNAIMAGAYSLSSNWCGGASPTFAGTGWVIAPDGNVLQTTSDAEPFVTVTLDLRVAKAAKLGYPRYVPELG